MSDGLCGSSDDARRGKRISPMHYAWRNSSQRPAKALAWWLERLRSETTRRSLIEQHEGLLL